MDIYAYWWWSVANANNASSGCFSHSFELMPHSSVPRPFHQYGVAYSSGDLTESHPIPLPSLHCRKGSLCPVCVPPIDRVDSESGVDIKPGDSGLVIGYQVNEFTHTWSAAHFIAQSHISCFYLWGVNANHFPLEPGCEDYSFIDQAVKDLEHGLNSILRTLLTHWNKMHSLMRLVPFPFQSFWSLYTQLKLFLIILDCKSLLWSNLVNYGARLWYYFYL